MDLHKSQKTDFHKVRETIWETGLQAIKIKTNYSILSIGCSPLDSGFWSNFAGQTKLSNQFCFQIFLRLHCLWSLFKAIQIDSVL